MLWYLTESTKIGRPSLVQNIVVPVALARGSAALGTRMRAKLAAHVNKRLASYGHVLWVIRH